MSAIATQPRAGFSFGRLTEIARSDERVTWVGIGVLLLARLALSRHEIAYPGLQGDETLFVNAATLRLPGLYETHVLHGIPLMVFPYIGALKSWIYDPILAIFGNDPTTLRMPAVVIVCAGLALVYPAVRDLVNKPVALLSFVALSFDNSVFWLTRDDVGPSALEFFFKCAALFCVARYARRPRARWVVLLVVSLGLGVFNKLNFIWDVNAAVAVAVVVIAFERAKVRAHLRELATLVAGLAVIYAGFAAYYLGDHIGSLVPGASNTGLAQLWPLFDQGTRAILSGTWFYAYALEPTSARNTIVTIILVLFAVGAITSVASARLRSIAVAGIAIATLLTAAQILDTPQATAGWHYVTIYPFVTIVAAYGAYAAAQLLPRPSRTVPVALTCAGVLWLVYSGLLMDKYFGAIDRQTVNSAWSPAVYKLSHYIQSTDDHVFMADWGIFNPIFALHPSTRYSELAFALESPSHATILGLRRWITGPSFPGTSLFVTHAPGQVLFPDSTAELFKVMGRRLRLATVIDGPGGKPVYDVYASTVPAASA